MHIWTLLVILAAGPLPCALSAELQPGAPVDYAPLAFQPKVWEEKQTSTLLLPWEGEEIVFLTTPGTYDPALMAHWVTALDRGWALYADLTGATPRPFKHLNGKATIAAVPGFEYTCGAGCGYLGATGIELAMFYRWNYPALQRNPAVMPHYVFYEMGRNFLTFGDRHSCFSTGYAVFMRYVCMDTLGYVDEDMKTRRTIERVESVIRRDRPPFFQTFTNAAGPGEKSPRVKDAQGRWIQPSDQPVTYASAMLRLRREHGGDAWVRRFFQGLKACPRAPRDSLAGARQQCWNWLVAASAAAGKDLSPIFVGDWNMPLTAETCQALAGLNWQKSDLTVEDILGQVPPEWTTP
jgi:hypothetical protein